MDDEFSGSSAVSGQMNTDDNVNFREKVPYNQSCNVLQSTIDVSQAPVAENTNVPSTSYSVIASGGLPLPRVKNVIKLKIIPPFQKKHFENKASFEAASKDCLKAVVSAFPVNLRSTLTVSTSFTNVGTKKMHSINVVASSDAAHIVNKMQTCGISMLGRTIFPTGENFWQSLPGLYPKFVAIKLLHLPALCSDDELSTLLEIPEGTEIISVKRLTDTIEGMTYYNGKASVSIKITSSEHEKILRQWSLESHESKIYNWEEIPVYAFIPALHNCSHCKNIHKPYHGHDIAWCRYAKQIEPPVNPSASADPILENKVPSLVPNTSSNSESGSESESESTKNITNNETNENWQLVTKKRKTPIRSRQAAEKRSRSQFIGKKADHRQLKKVKRLDMKSCLKPCKELGKK